MFVMCIGFSSTASRWNSAAGRTLPLFKKVVVIARFFIQVPQTPVKVVDPVFQPIGVVAHAANGETADRFMMGGYCGDGLA